MLPVTQDFQNKIKDTVRRIFGKVTVDYTDPFMDQSITATTNEQANVSYPAQTADAVQNPARKFASLDGSWLLDGSYYLAPGTADDGQMGWWGSTLAGSGGAFVAPYPMLTVNFFSRPIHSLKVVGDSARGEYPVDFIIKLYDSAGSILHTETVTGNTLVSWNKQLGSSINSVVKTTLEIQKWSHVGRQVKILEFFTSIQETYEGDDILLVNLLEERDVSQGSLPVGNISANEIEVKLNNIDHRFDAGNTQSPLYELLKANRRIRAWIGIEAENIDSENHPTFNRNSVAYLSDGTQVASGEPRFENGGIVVEPYSLNLVPNADTLSQHYFQLTGAGSEITNLGSSVADGVAHIYFQRTGTTGSDYRLITGSTYWTINKANIYVITVELKIEQVASGITLAMIGSAVQVASPQQKAVFDLYSNGTIYAANGCTILQDVILPDGYRRISAKIPSTFWAGTGTTTRHEFFTGWQNVGVYNLRYRKPMLEWKDYPTSFVEGSRSEEVLSISTAGILDKDEGNIELIINPLVVRSWNNFLYMNFGSNNRFLLFFSSDGRVTWDYGPVNDYIGSAVGTAVQNQPIRVGMGWSKAAGVRKMWIMGNYIGSKVFTTSYDFLSSLPIVVASTGSAIVSDVHFSSMMRPDEDMVTRGTLDQLPIDEHTTYVLPLKTSIYPLEMCWKPLGTFWSGDWEVPEKEIYAHTAGRDRMELLRKSTYSTSQVQINVTLYDLAIDVLEDVGLTPEEYWVDTELQNYRIPYAWFNPLSHREALRMIAEACLGQAYCDRNGVVRVEGPSFLASKIAPDLTITRDDFFTKDHPVKWLEIANYIEVDTQPLRPATVAEEIYRSNEPVNINSGQTKTLTVFYNETPVIEAVASLEGAPAGASITEATYYAWGANLKISSLTNSGTFVLVINGKPLRILNKERAIAQDADSITDNGKLRYEFPANPLVQTLAVAQNIADKLLAAFKNPRRDITLPWRGNPALALGDRITAPDYKDVSTADYHVISQTLEYDGGLGSTIKGRRAT